MSVFLRQIQHLLPRSRVWKLPYGSNLRKFFEGLAGFGGDAKTYVDSVYEDLIPETTRELTEWEKQHGLFENASKTEAERRAALDAEWEAQGGQSKEYIEGVLQTAGFDVYLHPSWVEGRYPGELANAFYSGRMLDVSSAHTNTQGLFFGDNGRKFYSLGTTSQVVAEWDLSIEYRIDTATASGNALNVSAQATVPVAGHIGNGGLTLFVLNLTDDSVYQYDLTTPWDLSTASYSGNSFSVGGQQTNPFGLTFKPDGTRFYIVGLTAGSVFEYELSTAWDLSTASYGGTSFNPGSVSGKRGIDFTEDGLKMVICGNEEIAEVTLSTAWDITTAVHVPGNLNPSEFGAVLRDVALGGNGGPNSVGYKSGITLYAITDDDEVYQYSLADYEPRNPNDWLTSPLLGSVTCGGTNNTCRALPNVDVVCNTRTTSTITYLVNSDLTNRAPPLLPTDPDLYPYFIYVGAETFGENADIITRRQLEFERLLLKLCPAQHWIGLFIHNTDELATEAGGLLTTEAGIDLTTE